MLQNEINPVMQSLWEEVPILLEEYLLISNQSIYKQLAVTAVEQLIWIQSSLIRIWF